MNLAKRPRARPRFDRVLLVAVITLLAVGWPAAAQSIQGARSAAERGLDGQGPVSSEPFRASEVGAALDRDLVETWRQRQQLSRRGGPAAAEQAGEEIVGKLANERYGRFPDLADALVLEGLEARKSGDLSAARDAFKLARELDPQSSKAWWLEARTRLSSGDGVAVFAKLGFQAVAAAFSGFWSRYEMLVEILFSLWVVAIVGAVVLVVCLLFREAPVIAHAVDEMLPLRWHQAWRSAIGWTVVLAPLSSLVMGAWAIPIWAAQVICFGGPRSRRWAGACLVVLALATPTLGVLTAASQVPALPEARMAVDAAERAYRSGNVDLVASVRSADPGRPLWAHVESGMLGLREPNQTVSLLRQAIEGDGSDARYRILLGNIFYGLDKFEPASAAYREALQIESDNIVALFNLAKARLAMLDFDEHEEILDRAMAADPVGVAELQEHYGDDRVAGLSIGIMEVTREVVWPSLSSAIGGSWRLLNPLTAVALAALLASFALRSRLHLSQPILCEGCGQAICSRCTPRRGKEEASHCVACNHLFSGEAGLAPAARAEQTQRIDRHLRSLSRMRRLVQFVCPGPALIHEGRFLGGAVQMLFWVAVWSAVLGIGSVVPSARAVAGGAWSILPWVAVGLVWGVSQLPLFAPRPVARPRVS